MCSLGLDVSSGTLYGPMCIGPIALSSRCPVATYAHPLFLAQILGGPAAGWAPVEARYRRAHCGSSPSSATEGDLSNRYTHPYSLWMYEMSWFTQFLAAPTHINQTRANS